MTLKIKTSRFGLVNYEDNDVLRFPDGLLGFEAKHNFILIPQEVKQQEGQKDSPLGFVWLQSLDDSELAFVLIDPLSFRAEYEIPWGEPEKEALGERDEVAVYAVVTIPPDPIQMTANLRGPVVINKGTGRGKQLVLSNSRDFTTRHYILAELQYTELQKIKAKQEAVQKQKAK
ncbi:MAG: flagellar assembly protein FliW [Firmicutes bacterium HGW-Firmicutes-14]|nr:MAG: flagellar assembly protein FliW [Firmicutes bacterium HGW-Firmicutes-14]